jgi:uncharacterized membrane protein (UPF0127 family)
MNKKTTSLKNKKNIQKSFWRQRNILIILLIAVSITVAYYLFFRKITNEPKWIKEGEVTFISHENRQQLSKIDVEVASNPTERQQGLMFRSKMDEDRGMLFIFEQESMESFWMKNTIMPLDIIFIDSKGVINTIHSNTVPYSEKSLPSKSKTQFVVEVNAGYCQRHGIKEQDLIEYKLDVK